MDTFETFCDNLRKQQKIHVRIKRNPNNPFNSMLWNKVIAMRDIIDEYILYIHNNYLTIYTAQKGNDDNISIL